MSVTYPDATPQAEWLSRTTEMIETLYELEKGDNFAVKIERPWGTSIRHITVEKGPYPQSHNYADSSLAEPFDVVLKGESRQNPTADCGDSIGISYDPAAQEVYLKVGVGRFWDIEAIMTDTLAVNYNSDVMLAAKCGCGQTTPLPIDQNDLPLASEGMIKGRSGLLTPCCRSSEWSTTLRSR